MIKEELIFFTDDNQTEDECLKFMINKAEQNHLLSDKEEYLKAVYQREEEFSTAVGFCVAIPHGMSDAVKESFIGFMKASKPILWGKDKKKVQLIFLIGVPEHEKNISHLKFISQISKHLINEDFRNKLISCKSTNEAFNYLNIINEGIRGV